MQLPQIGGPGQGGQSRAHVEHALKGGLGLVVEPHLDLSVDEHGQCIRARGQRVSGSIAELESLGEPVQGERQCPLPHDRGGVVRRQLGGSVESLLG